MSTSLSAIPVSSHTMSTSLSSFPASSQTMSTSLSSFPVSSQTMSTSLSAIPVSSHTMSTSLSSFPASSQTLPGSYAMGPHTERQWQYFPQVTNPFERPRHMIPPSASLPSAMPAPAQTINGHQRAPAQTQPPYVINNQQMAPQSSAAAQSSTAGDATCLNIDEILSWIADFDNPDCVDGSSQVDQDLTGLLAEIMSESTANVDGDVLATAAAAAGVTSSHSQLETVSYEPQDAVSTNYTQVMSELQELNQLGRLT